MSWENDLIGWYLAYSRELPWRESKNGYRTWISEVILQQTRVDQGIDYFIKFIEKYPTIEALASSTEQEVLLIWQGLGYYSRARNLYKGAKQIIDKFNSDFNQSPSELMQISGIGHYTANAIASIAYDYPIPAIDGNVYRVMGRFWGIKEPIPSEKGRKLFTKLLLPSVRKQKPSLFNQALMELGALVCTPINPKCNTCPLKSECFAYKNSLQKEFPIKIKKNKRINIHLAYFHFADTNNNTILHKRTNGIWKGLYEFINIESKIELSKSDLIKKLSIGNVNNIKCIFKTKHKLTHKDISANFWKIKVESLSLYENFTNFEIQLEEIENYPIHRLMKKYIDSIYS